MDLEEREPGLGVAPGADPALDRDRLPDGHPARQHLPDRQVVMAPPVIGLASPHGDYPAKTPRCPRRGDRDDLEVEGNLRAWARTLNRGGPPGRCRRWPDEGGVGGRVPSAWPRGARRCGRRPRRAGRPSRDRRRRGCPVAQPREGIAPIPIGPGVGRVEPDRLVEVHDRPGVVPRMVADLAPPVAGLGVRGLEPDHLGVVRQGPVVLAQVGVDPAAAPRVIALSGLSWIALV